MAKKRSNRKKRGKGGLILFVTELVLLFVLATGLFAFSRIQAGIRNIGSKAGVSATAGSGQAVKRPRPEGHTPSAGGTASAAEEPAPAEDAYVLTDDYLDMLRRDADAALAEENDEVKLNSRIRGYTNIALVGIDTRDSGQIDYANSDTMLIASINNKTGKVRLVSVYRDTLLNIGSSREDSVPQGDSDDFTEAAFAEEEVYTEEPAADEVPAEETYEEVPSDDGGETEAGTETEENYSSDGGDDNTGGGSAYNSGDTGASASWDNTDTSDDDAEEYRYANNDEFDASVLSEESNAFTGATTAAGRYDKANAAYANGSARQLITMLNRNLDLNIHDYIVVDFNAVAILVDDVGGIDVWMTYEEVVHMNNYCIETSMVTGKDYEPIEPEEEPRNYHLNGVQAVSYSRIRYTTGNDMKRTQRQRVVISKVVEKTKTKSAQFVQGVIRDVFPLCKTSLSSAGIISLATRMFSLDLEKTTGFPFAHIEKDVYVGSKKLDAVVPVTLAMNVAELHEFLFDDSNYEVSSTVSEYSRDIESLSNLTEKSRDAAEKNSVIGLSGGEADEVI